MNQFQISDLRRQAVEQLRAGYDGHNRRAIGLSMRELTVRRWRRRANGRVRATVQELKG